MYDDGRLGSLSAFITYLEMSNQLKKTTASSYRTAISAILGDDNELHVLTHVDDADVAVWVDAYKETHPSVSEATLDTYRYRFGKSLELYRQWLKDPTLLGMIKQRRTEPSAQHIHIHIHIHFDEG